MPSRLNLGPLRKDLLDGCREINAALVSQEDAVKLSSGVVHLVSNVGSAPSPAPASDSTATEIIFGTIGLKQFRAYIHGMLVANWQHYLSTAFGRAIDHLLLRGDVKRLPKTPLSIRPRALDPGSFSRLRRSVAANLQDSFDGLPYDQRSSVVRSLFKVPKDDPAGEAFGLLKKHVLIRNLVQHHHGKVRRRDLDELGVKTIDIPGDDGSRISHALDEVVKVTRPAIEQLTRTLDDASAYFEVLP